MQMAINQHGPDIDTLTAVIAHSQIVVAGRASLLARYESRRYRHPRLDHVRGSPRPQRCSDVTAEHSALVYRR